MSEHETPDTHAYRAFGLDIISAVELAGFTPSSVEGAPDIRVRVGPVEQGTDGAQHVGAKAAGILRATIQNGSDLLLQPDPSADSKFVGAVLTGELFSVLLRQRGYLVLHGSGVAKDGVAVGFVGDSGWGKSTLAASLMQRGWRLLTDDLLVVDGLGGTGEAPTVVPSHPSMRLSEDAADVVAEDDHSRERAHAHTTKVRMDWVESFSDQAARLICLFVLDPTQSGRHESIPMSSREAIQEFVHHTRVRRLLDAESSRREHFSQCVQLAQRVPTSYLRREYGLEKIGYLCDLVEGEVDRVMASI